MLGYDVKDVTVEVKGRSATTISYVNMFMFTVMGIEKERPRADGDCCLQGVCAVQRGPLIPSKFRSLLPISWLDSSSTVGLL
jgi:hypothetical protein